MSELGEGVNPPVPEQPEEKKEDPKKSIKIRCLLFFDGTLNNRFNTEERLKNSDIYQNNKDSGSYENDYTNVATLEQYVTPESQGYDEVLTVYSEGPGTVNFGSDKTRGYGLGSGETGVKTKVAQGMARAVLLISQGTEKDREPNDYIIEKLTLDVFGFSRGAAAARYCIYKLLKDDDRPIQKRLELVGFEVKKVEVCFAGLFDTVASYNGGQLLHTDNWVLKLKSVREAQKVVQLAAAEEHRKHFPLHNIKSAGSKGEQYYLPGVHSDVGGSYRDDATSDENMVIFRGTPRAAKKDRDNLVSAGWYKQEEFTEEIVSFDEMGRPDIVQSRVNRTAIHSAYCLIPLKIMAEFSEKNGVNIKPKLIKRATSIINKFQPLGNLEKHINKHIAEGSSKSSPDYWIDFHINNSWHKEIRHNHLHFSAKYETGLKPRFSFFSGKRQRYEFDG